VCLQTSGPKEYLPTHRAQEVGEIDERDAPQDLEPADAFAAVLELLPIETAPGADLQINERAEHDEDNGENDDLLTLHPIVAEGPRVTLTDCTQIGQTCVWPVSAQC
jgi:hypothetical protein